MEENTMKRIFVFWMFSVASLLPLRAQVNINLNVRTPMPSQLYLWERDPSLVQLVISNSDNTVYRDVRVFFHIVNAENGIEVARSKDDHPDMPRFTIQGRSTMTLFSSDLINVNAVSIDEKIRTIVSTTNSIPEDNYQYCVNLVASDGSVIAFTGEACKAFSVLIPDPPTLLTPANGDTISAKVFPRFSWTPIYVAAGVQAKYRLVIAPVFAGQSGRDAIERNQPLEDREVVTASYQYLPSDPSFSLYPGAEAFAWQVQAVNEQGDPATRNDGKSEIYNFTIPRTSQIVGYKFKDANGNGTWEGNPNTPSIPGNETGISGLTITLRGPENQTTTTDQNGRFEFIVHTPGTYIVTQPPSSGWVPTTPSSVTRTILLFEGETVAEVLFGDKETQTTSDPGTTTTTTTSTTTGPTCGIKIEEDVAPKMDGGLTEFSKGEKEIYRDDFIPLEAEGRDYDKVKWKCTPSNDCEETPSEREWPLTSRVKFEWEIKEGEGSFKKLGCLPENLRKDQGEHTIFQPPYVPLPEGSGSNKKITRIKLKIIDDNPTQPKDLPDVERTVTIETSRKKSSPDKYFIKITSEAYTLPAPPPTDEKTKIPCEASLPEWKNDDDFVKPVIKLPPVADNDKLAVGEMMILEATDQHEKDELNVECKSRICTSTKDKKPYEDDVEFKWTILSGPGTFLGKNTGRFVIYQSPMSLPDAKDKEKVLIQCEVFNPFGLQIVDKPKKDTVAFYVHNAGVKVSHPAASWLPTDTGKVELTSTLQYADGIVNNELVWKDALAHQCRIHFLELKNVSQEPGICINSPVKAKADKCNDLNLKQEKEHEAFSPQEIPVECKGKKLFLEARTQKPVKTYSINIYSNDFGSYGFLRSYANAGSHPDNGQIVGAKPFYRSIPVKETEVAHPKGRKKKEEYKDNRVTIPMDIDENHICDTGWKTTLPAQEEIPDPVSNIDDEDTTPEGNKRIGDGFSNYEEYRGMMVTDKNGKASHIRTHNLKKELFVCAEKPLPFGIWDLFEKASGITICPINKDQYNGHDQRFVNFNHKTAHSTDMRGLHLLSGDPEKGQTDEEGGGKRLGITLLIKDLGGGAGISTPVNIEKIVIFPKAIEKFCKDAGPKNNPLDFKTKLLWTVAHEMSHGCNVKHHGISLCRHAPDVAIPGIDVIPCWNTKHGIRSGDVNCIMRYDNVGGLHTRDPIDCAATDCPAKFPKPEAIGSVFCTGKKGTGYNANDKCFGDADEGDCIHQFQIRH
ncbi:MAG: hypothetical protein HY707_12380 [Ignavibacteriae bacterium]|nr:hypothetical protein [Ignavibacteriota bacterium]